MSSRDPAELAALRATWEILCDDVDVDPRWIKDMVGYLFDRLDQAEAENAPLRDRLDAAEKAYWRLLGKLRELLCVFPRVRPTPEEETT